MSQEGRNSLAHAASMTAPGNLALPAYEPIAPGASARCNTFLRGKVFVIIGSFPEVHPDWLYARSTLEKMLKAFGATVNKKLSRKTSKCSSA